MFENPFVLSSSSVALPPYSTLVIGLDLYEPRLPDKYSILLDWVRFTPQHFGKVSHDLSTKDGKVVVRVEVAWWSVRLKPPISEASTGAIKPQQELPLPASSQETSLALRVSRKPCMLRGARLRGVIPLMEIFSIHVGHQKNEVLRFYGKIDIQDSLDRFRNFERCRSSAVILCPSSKTLPIVYLPYDCFMGNRLYMILNLKDVEGSVVIRGYITWTLTDYDSPHSWLDSRICSVIQGENGYAAVHYTLLSTVTPAAVKILFCSKGSTVCANSIYGRIVVRYHNHVYLTKYDKDYYQTILFNRSPDDTLLVTNQRVALPLSRSVFGVPVNSSLIVDVDLSTDLPDSRLKDTVEFQVDIPSHARIEGADCFILVYTYW